MGEKDSFLDRVRSAWNVFKNKSQSNTSWHTLGTSYYGQRPDRPRFSSGTESTLTAAIFTRIGIDVSAFKMQHVLLDEKNNLKEVIDSGLNYCLNVEANIDQTGASFVQDIVMSLCDEGTVAVVPVDKELNVKKPDEYDILSLRTGKIMEWFPRHVRVRLYNDRLGQPAELILPKSEVAIIENPFYAVMNEPNSTLRRLIHKLNLLDILDNKNSSGKLDLILQLPYTIKTELRREQAEERRKAIEDQLIGSKYGIAYTDGTERITQLNRPAENNLMRQIEVLTSMLYSQLGISESVLNGTASEVEMLNYNNRTLQPFGTIIVDSLSRSFLSYERRKNGEDIRIFSEPFRFVPVKELATVADRFTRNEILSSNEVRSIIGFAPSSDPRADELVNKNMPQANKGNEAEKGEDIEKEEPESEIME